MIILGLGTNVGDRLTNLRQAIAAIKKIPDVSVHAVSPIYHSSALLPDGAPATWDQNFLNLSIGCQTTLEPQQLLAKINTIMRNMGREVEREKWKPRVIDIDILAWNDLVIQTPSLTIPHLHLLNRPFALWPLADILPLWRFPLAGAYAGKTAAELVEHWGSRFTGKAPLQTRQIRQRINVPQLMGIINITPDSFSDGNLFLETDAAIAHGKQLIDQGAEILDIGAESTSPTASPITPQQEWQRLEPVLTKLAKERHHFFINPIISIDTRHLYVAEKALDYGVNWINDVSGLDSEAMRELIRTNDVKCIVMHHQQIPERRSNVLARDKDPVALVYEWGARRLSELEKSGISLNKLIFDPGIGFGKMAEQSLLVLKQAALFKKLGVEILIGHSRKTFLATFTASPFPERDIETTALSIYLTNQKIDYLRVHHVEMVARSINTMVNLENLC